MANQTLERRLAAIVSADVVGYSRLMGSDETGTLTRLKVHRRELIDPTIQQYQGRIVKLMGDGILIEFSSAVAAVSCAIAIQQALVTRNEDIPEALRIVFRMGINLGDVIVEEDDIFGDGVNLAARIEALAEPGSVYISEDVYRQVRSKLDFDFIDRGTHQVKNIAEPVQVYRVEPKFGEHGNAETATPHAKHWLWRTLALAGVLIALLVAIVVYWQPWQPSAISTPDKPSIAVLPFTNMSADPEQEYFVDGMTEDLITDLSKVSGLFVIARNSAFAYKGQMVDIQEVAQELNVRYVLVGSVRKAGERLRINAQLIDTQQVGHLWAERYDRQLVDIFDLQDEVTGHIVTTLSVTLTAQEKQQLAYRYTDNPEAYDYFLRGQSYYYRLTQADIAQARELYQRAIELDPTFARAYSVLAMTHVRDADFGWSTDLDASWEQALKWAHEAIALDATLPQAHFVRGFVYLSTQQHEAATKATQQALSIDPNYADGYALLAFIYNFSDQADKAIDTMAHVMRLNPQLSGDQLNVLGAAYYWAGRYHEAVATLHQSIEIQHNFRDSHYFLAAAYQQLGLYDEAEWELAEILTLDPEFSLQRLTTEPYKYPAQRERLLNDLRKVGFPE